ncbi:sigma-70 family RNA polymerase sigma factor [Sphingomonas paeninsulae]|uniref:sigma-70 family RNA polymerase sigma factor n=1 Tax=Sphingomonas paeninsulae TaxID=2319844 RepID=UPI001EF00942|nr:sigma-70 family RNA polymerase sigma factor [Sphingomonas paeninsulae]
MHRRRRSHGNGSGIDLTGDVASIERAALVTALQRVAAGDSGALQDVYRRTSAKLYGVCLRIFPDTDEAEDALQDAFINVWQKAGSFDPARASPITWLVALTRNKAIDRLRARGKHIMAPIDAADEVADTRPDIETCLIGAQADARILACIEALPRGDATLIRTAFFDGSTYADIAERAGAPLGTVKSRVRRALLKLRECLA